MAKIELETIIPRHKFRPFMWLIVVLAAVLIAVIASRQASAPSPPSSAIPNEGSTLTVAGEFVCLPHKDTSGPQTQECAYGLKSGDTYYALNDSTADSLFTRLATGSKVTVTGSFSAHPNTQYQDIGMITVTEAQQK